MDIYHFFHPTEPSLRRAFSEHTLVSIGGFGKPPYKPTQRRARF